MGIGSLPDALEVLWTHSKDNRLSWRVVSGEWVMGQCLQFLHEWRETLGISIHLCSQDDVENFVLLGDVDTSGSPNPPDWWSLAGSQWWGQVWRGSTLRLSSLFNLFWSCRFKVTETIIKLCVSLISEIYSINKRIFSFLYIYW